MFAHIPPRVAVVLFGGGAVGVAFTTALEVFTAPYSTAVSFYQLNSLVHMVKVVALASFVIGLLGVLAHWGDRLGPVGKGAGLALAVATTLGAVPYTVIESSLDPGLTPSAADARLEAIYDDHVWVGALASVAMPIIVFGVVTLAVVVMRRRLLPIWAALCSLLAIPVGIVAMVISESTGVALPHPPAWIFLGLASYAAAIRATDGASRSKMRTQPV